MARKSRRASCALRFEALESRTLLSTGGASANELFVRFVPGAPETAVQAAFSAVGGHAVTSYPDGTTLIALDSGVDAPAALGTLKADPEVQYAEADGTLQQSAFVPNDPQFSHLWGLNNWNNVDIDAPEAWSTTTGNPATIVAVLDTGIDLNNPDLVNNLWRNPDTSGADGFPNDVFGWNFVSNNSNVQDGDGHGTHVSGILAAQGNNLTGVVGVDWNAKIMVVKVLDNVGNGTTDAAVAGIYYAVQHGARVINASWGGGPYSQAMANAIAYAAARNVVFVTAAGNQAANSDVQPSYPGSYNLANEITVAAIDSSGNLADFSDYGARSVDLAAPGVDILSTIPGGFATYSGTSMATPYVTGVVALVLGIHPEFTAAQAIQRVLSTTKPLSTLSGKTITGGMVDAAAAVDFGTAAATPGGGTVTATAAPTLAPGVSSDPAVLAQLLGGNDFYSVHGGTNSGFVTALYQVLAARDPDPVGLSFWLGQLQGGMSRTNLAFAFEHTNEAYQVKVAHWYQDDLGWTTPIAQLKNDPGVVYWSGMLAAGQADNAVLARILSTDDYFASKGGTLTSFVSALYPTLLGRPADSASLNAFVSLLQGGMSRSDLIQLLETTVEGRRTKVAHWYQEYLLWSIPFGQIKSNDGVGYWAAFLVTA